MTDTVMLLIVCYVFGILTAAMLYLLIVSPLEHARARRHYAAGYMDGINYIERTRDYDI